MTASFETRPSGRAIAKNALRSSVEAFGHMKSLFLSATVVSLALDTRLFTYRFFSRIYSNPIHY